MFESYQGCWEESIPLICEENGQARVSGLLRFLGHDCDLSDGVTNVYAGIYGDVYGWITETIEANTPDTTATPTTTAPADIWEETTNDLPDGLVFASSSLNRLGPQEKLIGGQATMNPDKWKFMVQIGKQDTDFHDTEFPVDDPVGKKVIGYCHGTIVGDHWILTDGDCCHPYADNPYVNPYFVINFGQTQNAARYIGHHELPDGEWGWDMQVMSPSDSYFQLQHTSAPGSNVFVHPDYYNKAPWSGNDHLRVSVCLIKTNENFMQMAADNGQELLAPFMFESDPQEGKACWTAGWGSDNTDNGLDYGEHNEHQSLNVAGVNLIGHDTCKNYASSVIVDSMNQYDICAGNPENDGTQFINPNVVGTLLFMTDESYFIRIADFRTSKYFSSEKIMYSD